MLRDKHPITHNTPTATPIIPLTIQRVHELCHLPSLPLPIVIRPKHPLDTHGVHIRDAAIAWPRRMDRLTRNAGLDLLRDRRPFAWRRAPELVVQRAGGAETGGRGGEGGRRVGVGFGGWGNDLGRGLGWLLLWLSLLGGVAAFIPAEAGHVEVCAD